ncbi:MAG: hypothetical protein A2Y38_00275 [Spirochaetes bacterium GWB1_59_5]|nr:MAG: hypothetical protein A2Y38_00275 [Spirochaetes bacterium GWB1_59_5]
MELKGKLLSLGAKILGALVVLGGLVLKAFNLTPALSIDDVIKTAAFVVLVFSPIDVSIWLEKIFTRNSGGPA